MTVHKVYIQAHDDMSGQEVVMAIAHALSEYAGDCAECVKCSVNDEERAEWQARKELAESIGTTDSDPVEDAIDPWGSEPDFPKEDWLHEVRNDDTHLGYVAWVLSQREQQDFDATLPPPNMLPWPTRTSPPRTI